MGDLGVAFIPSRESVDFLDFSCQVVTSGFIARIVKDHPDFDSPEVTEYALLQGVGRFSPTADTLLPHPYEFRIAHVTEIPLVTYTVFGDGERGEGCSIPTVCGFNHSSDER